MTWVGPDGTATDEAFEVLGDIVVETQGVDGSAPPTLTTYVVAMRVDTCGRRWYHNSEGTTPSRHPATAIDPAVDRTSGIEIRLGEPPVVGPCEP